MEDRRGGIGRGGVVASERMDRDVCCSIIVWRGWQNVSARAGNSMAGLAATSRSMSLGRIFTAACCTATPHATCCMRGRCCLSFYSLFFLLSTHLTALPLFIFFTARHCDACADAAHLSPLDRVDGRRQRGENVISLSYLVARQH